MVCTLLGKNNSWLKTIPFKINFHNLTTHLKAYAMSVSSERLPERLWWLMLFLAFHLHTKSEISPKNLKPAVKLLAFHALRSLASSPPEINTHSDQFSWIFRGPKSQELLFSHLPFL